MSHPTRLSQSPFAPRRRTPFKPLPYANQSVVPPSRTSPRKRPRPSSPDLPTLPCPPPLPTTNNFFFKGLHPKFIREVNYADHSKMWVTCGTPGCTTFKRKSTNRKIDGTNLYKTHYLTHHKGVPTSVEEENEMLAAGKKATYFVPKPGHSSKQSRGQYKTTYRSKLLAFIVKNNLSFQLVEQDEFMELIRHLNPIAPTISKTTLVRDLKKEFKNGQNILKEELAQYVKIGGRFSLTTDCWTASNYKEFAAITIHWVTPDWEQKSQVLDIVELTNPVHSGAYLAKEVIKATDFFNITHSIVAITHDNASVNDVLLQEFQDIALEKWKALGDEEQCRKWLQFTLEEGDIRCVSHICNLGVIAGIAFSCILLPPTATIYAIAVISTDFYRSSRTQSRTHGASPRIRA